MLYRRFHLHDSFGLNSGIDWIGSDVRDETVCESVGPDEELEFGWEDGEEGEGFWDVADWSCVEGRFFRSSGLLSVSGMHILSCGDARLQ